MRAPVGIVEIAALYGDPTAFVRDDGTVSPLWEARMVKVALPGPIPLGWRPGVAVSSVRVNQAIAAEVDTVLRGLKKAGMWDYITTFDGGYTWRPQRGSRKLSMHAFGGALDFNAETNGLNMTPDMHPGVVEVFETHGWEWGGRWQRLDGCHFQYARGY
jgi:hypothetical protein